MSTQTIKAGEAWWAITARDQATKVLDTVAARLKSIGRSTALAGAALTAGGTAVVAPMLAAAKSFSDYVDGLNDTKVQTGFAVESLSQLAFVAGQQGTSLDGLKKGLVGMSKFTTQVAAGGKGAVKVLDALGISSRDFLAMSPEQRFKVLAEQISKIEDPSLRAGMAMKVFGKAGNEMLPTLALGAKGIEDMQRRAAELGLTISQADADKFGAFGDELSAIGEQAQRAWWGLGAALIEAVTPFIPLIQEAMRTLIEFIDNNRTLVSAIVIGTGVVIALGVALTVVGGIMIGLGAVASATVSIIGFLSTACTVAAAAFAALLSPVGLVVLAIAAVVAVCTAAVVAWFQLTESGQRAASAIARGFAEMWALVKQVFGGIWDALASGDWGLAAEIGFKAVSLAWSIEVAGMSDVWWGFINFVGSALIGALQGVLGAMQSVLDAVVGAVAWAGDQVVAVFGGAWELLLSGLQSVLDAILSSITWVAESIGGTIGDTILGALQFVESAIRTVLGSLVDAYNWAAEKMGWATTSAIADGSSLLADMQTALDSYVGKQSAENWAEVKRVRKELDALTKKAADARAARQKSVAVSSPEVPDYGQPDLGKLQGSGRAGSRDGGGVLGTFNAAVAGMLNSSLPDHLEKIAENTAETNEKLDEMNDKLDDAGLAWQ